MATPATPVLEYPLGSESISTKIIEIKWKAQNATVGQFDPTYLYEILYKSADPILAAQAGWERLATLPSSSQLYNWIIPEYLFGSKIMIAVRSLSKNGNGSSYAQSGIFEIEPKPLPKPSVSNPVAGKVYGSQIVIQLNNPMLIEDTSKLNRYRINLYYSSPSNSVSYAPIIERISGSTTQVIWETSQLSPADDYVMYAFYSDDFGRKGPQVSIGPFVVENQGYMLIDTDGPEVAVKINSLNGYLKNRDISVELYAYDEIDDIHGFKLIENIRTSAGGIAEVMASEPRFYQKNNFLSLSDVDGSYVITALVEDLGGNRANEEDASAVKVQNKYRKFFSKNNFKITALAKTSDSLYACMYDGTYTQVIRVKDGKVYFISSFPGRIIALAVINEKIYGSKFNSDRVLELVSIESTGLVPLISLMSPDTEMSALHDSGDSGILLGCINGDVYRYFNQNITLLRNLGSGISSMYPGQFSSVFILTQSSEKVFIYNDGILNKVQITI